MGCAGKPWKMMLLKVARWHARALAFFLYFYVRIPFINRVCLRFEKTLVKKKSKYRAIRILYELIIKLIHVKRRVKLRKVASDNIVSR